MDILICPVCGKDLAVSGRSYMCGGGHSFDIAKEGYVNLLRSGKPGDSKGDNKDMARSRRDFLSKGYFAALARAVGDCAERYSGDGDVVLDVCCGEGYYTDFLTQRYSRDFYGFDISKNMVRQAGKRRCGATFFVANIANIPIRSGSVDFAFHLFAPFHAAEFSRILSRKGVIITAVAGRRHLYCLKSVLYDTPYENDEQQPEHGDLRLIETVRIRDEIDLSSREDIRALFQMTPYYYHTPTEGMRRLDGLDSLSTETEFILYIYGKAV